MLPKQPLDDLAKGGLLLFLEMWGKCKYLHSKFVPLDISEKNFQIFLLFLHVDSTKEVNITPTSEYNCGVILTDIILLQEYLYIYIYIYIYISSHGMFFMVC